SECMSFAPLDAHFSLDPKAVRSYIRLSRKQKPKQRRTIRAAMFVGLCSGCFSRRRGREHFGR
ncbi:MAG: hypothetical protein KAI38_10010, partial [Candidatus Latescibacteria bacterium]|nr:hypothetical protein [Candidatus Latescibacterota bacterium]